MPSNEQQKRREKITNRSIHCMQRSAREKKKKRETIDVFIWRKSCKRKGGEWGAVGCAWVGERERERKTSAAKRKTVGNRKLHLEMFRCLHLGGRVAYSRRISILQNAKVSTKRNTNPAIDTRADGPASDELKVKKRREWKERSENG